MYISTCKHVGYFDPKPTNNRKIIKDSSRKIKERKRLFTQFGQKGLIWGLRGQPVIVQKTIKRECTTEICKPNKMLLSYRSTRISQNNNPSHNSTRQILAKETVQIYRPLFRPKTLHQEFYHHQITISL